MGTAESTQPTIDAMQYEQIHQLVSSEFTIEEGFIEYNTPTFYVTPQPNQKQAFLRLYKKLDSMQLVPFLRKRENRIMLQIVPRPPIAPGRPLINIALLLATIGTTLFSGYWLSLGLTQKIPNPWIGAIMFSVALLSILGAHEMGHKLAANKYQVEASYPYFVPGLPPLGTFGAVIQQKSLPPNQDALFDLGMTGPVIGFIVTVAVSIIGIPMSTVSLVSELPSGTSPTPLLFDVLISILVTPTILPGRFLLIDPHPIAYAGYIGMIVTMLNLMPVGQLDGGHIAHALVGEKTRTALALVAITSMFFIAWPMALIALLLSRVRHPGPLDSVSTISRGRKLATIALVLIFILSLAPIAPLI